MWANTLSADDIADLKDLLSKFGPNALEAYLVLALSVRINGPIPLEGLDAVIADWDELAWRRIAGEFERRSDGCLHLKGALLRSAHVEAAS
jgi:hypothetical protein